MEPENLSPNIAPEKPNIQYERQPEVKNSSESISDTGIEKGAEKKEGASEAAVAIADSSFPTTLPTPVQTDDGAQNGQAAVQSASTPTTASDDDLIEKEWVDRAKKIVIDTREDPYSREEAVSKLQKEYKQKRYGRGVGGV